MAASPKTATALREQSVKALLNPSTDPDYILKNEREAAEFLGVSVRWLQYRRGAGLPPEFIKLPDGRLIRYRLSALMKCIDDNDQSQT